MLFLIVVLIVALIVLGRKYIVQKNSNAAYRKRTDAAYNDLQRNYADMESQVRDIQQRLRYKDKAEDRRKRFQGERREIEDQAFNKPEEFFFRKEAVMNSNESLAYFYICKAIHELFPCRTSEKTPCREGSWWSLENAKDLYVFPQVSLHAFFNIKESYNRANDPTKRPLLSLLGGKNVDFLVCQNIRGSDSHHTYKPVLAIELDGDSHREGKGTAKQLINDDFKNRLFNVPQYGIKLLRYQMDSDNHLHKSDYEKIKQRLQESLGSVADAKLEA